MFSTCTAESDDHNTVQINAADLRNSTRSREITNDDSKFCPKNWQLALEHLLHFRCGEGEDKEMTSTRNHTLVAALLSLLSIVIFSGITSAQPAPVVTGTLSVAVATVAPDGQSYSVLDIVVRL